MRRLTANDIADTVRKCESGSTTRQIGARYGISKTRVATVLREQGATGIGNCSWTFTCAQLVSMARFATAARRFASVPQPTDPRPAAATNEELLHEPRRRIDETIDDLAPLEVVALYEALRQARQRQGNRPATPGGFGDGPM